MPPIPIPPPGPPYSLISYVAHLESQGVQVEIGPPYNYGSTSRREIQCQRTVDGQVKTATMIVCSDHPQGLGTQNNIVNYRVFTKEANRVAQELGTPLFPQVVENQKSLNILLLLLHRLRELFNK